MIIKWKTTRRDSTSTILLISDILSILPTAGLHSATFNNVSFFKFNFNFMYIYVFQKMITRTIFVAESSNENNWIALSHDFSHL